MKTSRFLLPLFLFGVVAPGCAQAQFTGGVSVGASVSDNVFLAVSPNEFEDVVFQASPFLNYNHDTQHLDVLFDYGFDWYRYSDLETESSFHRGELIVVASGFQESLALEFGARRAQALSDPDQAIPTSTLPISGNILDQDEFWINPRINRDFGQAVNLTADYRISELEFGDDEVAAVDRVFQGNRNHNGRFALDNIDVSGNSGMTWALRYDYQETEYDSAPSFEFQRASGELGYWINQTLRVFGSGGQESAFDNPFDSSLEDRFWETGFAYSPSQRFSAEFAGGERTFGSSWRGSLDITFRRGSTSLRYNETPTTTGNNRSIVAAGILDLGDISELLDRVGTAQRFVAERLEWRVNFEWRRTTFNFSLFDEDRNDITSATGEPLGDEAQRGIIADASWQAGSRTSFFLGASLLEREFGAAEESEIWTATFAINYQISPRLAAALTLTQTEQQPRGNTTFAPDYVANVASLVFTATIF